MKNRLRRSCGPLCSLLLVSFSSSPSAVELWGLCAALEPLVPLEAQPDDKIRISAEHTYTAIRGVTQLDGGVNLSQQGRVLMADHMVVDQINQEGYASGNVTFRTKEYQLMADRGRVSMNSSEAEFNEARYRYPDLHAQGRAEQLRRDREEVSYLREATFSTCPEQQEDWVLVAKGITLNPHSETGTALNTYLSFKGVPILYVPIFSFPLGEARKSGFLTPLIESSTKRGSEVSIPYYWNIDPQMDATLTPRWMSDRGWQLQTETRYLNEIGKWQLDVDYMDQDRLYNNEARSFYRVQHKGLIERRWETSMDVGEASDKDYFIDMGNRLSIAAITHLERRADVSYNADLFTFSGRVQDFQTLDTTIPARLRPYKRAPQLLFDGRFPVLPGGIQYDLNAEWVQFEREDSDTGLRTDYTGNVSWPWRKTAGFLVPSLSMRQTNYELSRVSDGPRSISRTVPILSIDSGLYFDREPTKAGEPLQVLEPRLYYLRAPLQEQDEIPLFDSSLLGFSFAQLFRDNRFTGGDRVGDANQLSAGVTYRLIDPDNGHEMMSASLGRSYYFANREVTLLPTQDPDTEGFSDLTAEAQGRFSKDWYVKFSSLINAETGDNDKNDFSLRYLHSNDQIANFRYFFTRDAKGQPTQNQVDVAVRWPLNHQWRAMARWNYSLKKEYLLDSFVGLEYESCCWLFRLLGRESLSDDKELALEGVTQQAIYAQLVLKGLAPLGRGTSTLLEDGIIGYRAIED